LQPNFTGTASLNAQGDDHRDRNDHNDDRLEHEKPAELVRRDQKEGELETPEQNMRAHLL
jgi:hypothetical protein